MTTPDDVRLLVQKAIVLVERGDLATAHALCEQILKVRPNDAEALHLSGLIGCQIGQFESGLELLTKAIDINPASARFHSDRGAAFFSLHRLREALACFDRALTLEPEYVQAHIGRGNTLQALNQPEQALTSYEKAIHLGPELPELHYNRGNLLRALGQPNEGIAAYDRAIQLKPDFAEAYSNRGNTLHVLERLDEALDSLNRAVQLKPDHPFIHYNRGNVLRDLGRQDDAIASYDKAIQLKPDLPQAYHNRANALVDLQRTEEARVSYEKAFELDPHLPFLQGDVLHARCLVCNWQDWRESTSRLVQMLDNGEAASPPFPVLALPTSGRHQLRAAQIFTANRYPANCESQPMPAFMGKGKVRVGYFSSDLRGHPVGGLVAELIEKHDRGQFKIFGFSLKDANDDMRRRLQRSFDTFIDAQNLSDSDVTSLARRLNIAIAVDLNGFTGGCRPNIFARRAAPIQINYLGYPGTMGAQYIDYIVADPTLITAEHRQDYVEKIVYLPDTYQPNDTRRSISDRVFTRAELGLPAKGFVFCCFNNSYKITPAVFDDWMAILAKVPGSVLWLLETNALAMANLRREAAQRGIGAERLVFAKRIAVPEHLARHRLAGLFLDTLPYNAHTTASDALWAGLPVLTRIGDTFAGRVAASLLRAIRLPELVTTSRQTYRERAVELAIHPKRLHELKCKLARNRQSTPLFDITRYARHLEAAYRAVYARYVAGLPPDHIRISDPGSAKTF